MRPSGTAGLLLAAGSGSRLGRPKALLADPAGVTFLARALGVLEDSGSAPVFVVLGAEAEVARGQVPPGVRVVVAADWQEGMGRSLRVGLAAVAQEPAEIDAVLVMLVDTPGVTTEVVRRLVAEATKAPRSPGRGDADEPLSSALARSAYDGVPGHPVIIGRDHWQGVMESAQGDRGARDYLQAHRVRLVECADIGAGDDIDTDEALAQWWGRHGEGG